MTNSLHQNQENKDVVRRIDHAKIKDKKTAFMGGVYDSQDHYSRPIPKNIDVSNFSPLSLDELLEILGLTIKQDQQNKLVTFLCQLSAYTEDSQFNISFNAPSSTGKSFIPLEIAQLFPKEDVIKTGYASPTAFFHDQGEYKEELKGYEIDLERKILIFLDQPHDLLLQHLRPLLSHDEKEILIKITDKSQTHGLRTKNILLRGFSSVIFCTAGLKIDEQEATRMVLLSPEINQEKIREAIYAKVKKESDRKTYKDWLQGNAGRELLKERIMAIKQERIEEIIIKSPEKIEEIFTKQKRILKPRDARDVGRLISLVKTFALLNLWFRERNGQTIIANEDDISEAIKIWNKISESQELGIPPYIYSLYLKIVLTAFNEKNQIQDEESEQNIQGIGLTRQEIISKHFQVYGRALSDWKLRQEIIPMWESAGLITQERDIDDKRKILISPTTPFTVSQEQNNSE